MSIDAYKGSTNKGTESKQSSRNLGDQGPEFGKNFSKDALRRHMFCADPIDEFASWYADAEQKCSGYANPVSLASVDASGQPVVRTVLLKGFDQSGFCFYSNYQSRKGLHIEQNPRVSLCLYWEELERQIIIQGSAEKLSAAESDAYFASRAKGSQIGAHVSSQSQVIDSREQLETEMTRLQQLYAHTEVPRPAHWGGYRVQPASIEFWQGQPDRLHDRFIYQRSDQGWTIARLAP